MLSSEEFFALPQCLQQPAPTGTIAPLSTAPSAPPQQQQQGTGAILTTAPIPLATAPLQQATPPLLPTSVVEEVVAQITGGISSGTAGLAGLVAPSSPLVTTPAPPSTPLSTQPAPLSTPPVHPPTLAPRQTPEGAAPPLATLAASAPPKAQLAPSQPSSILAKRDLTINTGSNLNPTATFQAPPDEDLADVVLGELNDEMAMLEFLDPRDTNYQLMRKVNQGLTAEQAEAVLNWKPDPDVLRVYTPEFLTTFQDQVPNDNMKQFFTLRHPCLRMFKGCRFASERRFGERCFFRELPREWCLLCLLGEEHETCKGEKPDTHPCLRVWGSCKYGDKCVFRDFPQVWCLFCLRGASHTKCSGIRPKKMPTIARDVTDQCAEHERRLKTPTSTTGGCPPMSSVGSVEGPGISQPSTPSSPLGESVGTGKSMLVASSTSSVGPATPTASFGVSNWRLGLAVDLADGGGPGSTPGTPSHQQPPVTTPTFLPSVSSQQQHPHAPTTPTFLPSASLHSNNNNGTLPNNGGPTFAASSTPTGKRPGSAVFSGWRGGGESSTSQEPKGAPRMQDVSLNVRWNSLRDRTPSTPTTNNGGDSKA